MTMSRAEARPSHVFALTIGRVSVSGKYIFSHHLKFEQRRTRLQNIGHDGGAKAKDTYPGPPTLFRIRHQQKGAPQWPPSHNGARAS
jgi:hypothetical protein